MAGKIARLKGWVGILTRHAVSPVFCVSARSKLVRALVLCSGLSVRAPAPQAQGYVRVRLTKLANRDNSLFGVQMYNGECSQGDDCFAGGERAVTDSDAPPALDYQWASSLLGFVALAMAPFRTSPCKPSHVPVPWAGTADRFRQQFCSSSSARGSGAPRALRRPRRDAHALHIY